MKRTQKTKFWVRAFLQSLGGIFRAPPVTETENANCKVVSHHIFQDNIKNKIRNVDTVLFTRAEI